MDGIERKLEAPKQHKENLYHMCDEDRKKKGITNLPGSLQEALKEMKNSDLIKEALGEHAFTHYLKGKKQEYDEYRMSVSKWEIERYLNS